MNRTEELRALGLRRSVHISDGQQTREYVPAEDYDALAAERDALAAALREHRQRIQRVIERLEARAGATP